MSQSTATYINVIGAGLAGSEAAYQIAKRGIPVKLYEMRGVKATPQHKTTNFAELVCSNSFRGDSLTNAVGLLEEMRRLDSIIMRNGEANRVPAGEQWLLTVRVMQRVSLQSWKIIPYRGYPW